MKPYIEIKKQRSIDSIIEVSFKFFKLHIKDMLTIVWQQNRILLTLIIISYFLYTYYSSNLFTKLQQIGIGNGNINTMNMTNFGMSIVIVLIFAILSLIFFPRFFAAIAGYMQVYDKNRGEVDTEKVKQIVNDKFWGLLGLIFSLAIIFILFIIVVSFLFTGLLKLGIAGGFLMIALYIPLVLYLVVFLSLVFYVYFFDNVDISTAISRTVSYIKERFWFSFGLILLMSFIILFITWAVNIPLYVYLILKDVSLFGRHNMMVKNGDIFISLYSMFSYIAQLVLKVLTMISMVFLFFSIKEYHTNESMFDKIDQIGNDDANY